MKVLHLSASDAGSGAGLGAYRTHLALQRAGIQSEILVLRKGARDATTHRLAERLGRGGRLWRRIGEARHGRALQASPRRGGSGHWSLNLHAYPIASAVNAFAADIVQLHWVGDNFLPISELPEIQAPVVWTLRDMWAFTGGCHYAGDCQKYRDFCGNCPQLREASPRDLSWRVRRGKARHWARLNLTIVAISQWLADCARSSTLLRDCRIEVIGNPIDPAAFKALDRSMARRAFNLPLDKSLLLFGAVGGAGDPRKGYRYLREALQSLERRQDLALVTFGAEAREELGLDLPTHQIGYLHDAASLSLLYSACDLYALPTLQEALGKTLQEALACGTPCVAFDGSGASDVVLHKENGYLARCKDVADLRAGVEWTLAQTWDRDALRADLVQRYGAERVSEQYMRLYQSLLGGGS